MPLARQAMFAQGEQLHLAPTGDCDYLAMPLYEQEAILYADRDLADIIRAKHCFDVAGHYAKIAACTRHCRRHGK